MTNPINENSEKTTGCAGFFQGIADHLCNLGNLFTHIDQLAQMIFSAANSVKEYIWSFFASTTAPSPAEAEKVQEIAKETLVPQPVVVTEQPQQPPVVEMVEMVEEVVVEQALSPTPTTEEPNGFEKARETLDPFFKVNIQSPVLPIKVTPLEMDKTPEVSTTAKEQVTTLKEQIERNFPLFGMSFYPHLKSVEGKTFLANLGEEPYLIQAKTNEQHERTRLEAAGDHLTIFHQKRALVFYPIQK